ncbi:MAG: hypothetical protein PHC50_03395 [Candidatus Cloacimonetes bacterium]|nr:hypothetical protein [Candidatus Cloacimonadota bacterium]
MKRFTQRQSKAIARIVAKTPAVLPFAGDSPVEKSQRITRAIDNSWDGFSYFCSTYFPHIFDLPFCPAHEDMFRHTHNYFGIVGITGFRELGKTILMGVVYPIWRIARGDTFIVHIAADAQLAANRSALTHHQLSENRRILTDFPQLRTDGDDVSEFYLKNNAYILAAGINSSFRGLINPRTARRPDLIICDDIDLERNQGNQNIGRRKLRKILEEIGGAIRKSPDSVVILLGNLVHPNYSIVMYRESIIAHIRQDSPDFMPSYHHTLVMPQRKLLAYPLENPDGSSAWPEKYPAASFPQLRIRYGHTGYQREMLGFAVIDGNIFKNEWFAHYSAPPSLSKVSRVWLYCDPAWGEKGCFKAVAAIAYDGARFYLLRIWLRQTENTAFFRHLYDTTIDLLATYKARFRPSIETTFGQHRILDEFDRWARENALKPISHLFKRIDNRENKFLRIEATETTIESARLLFPVGQDTPALKSQYLSYPDGYIDGPDAIAGCLERFSEYSSRTRVRIRKMTV